MAPGKDFKDRFQRLRGRLEQLNAGTAGPTDGVEALALLAELEGIAFESARRHRELELARREQEQVRSRLTERVEGSEQERLVSERRYRALFDASSDAIFVIDLKGRIQDVNRAACERLGYLRGEMIGSMGLADLTLGGDKTLSLERLAALKDKETLSFESVHVRRDGSHVPVEVNARRIEYGDGPLVLATARDISSRVEAAEALENQVSFVQTLIDAAPAPIFFKDVKGVYQGCNAAFAELLGQTREEILGRNVFEISPSTLAKVYHEQDSRLLAEGGTQVYEFRAQSAQGEERDVLISKAAYHDTTGGVAGLVGVILDITERKRAEGLLDRARLDLEQRVRERTAELTDAYARLADSEQKYRTLYEQAGEGILLVDGQGRVLEANPAALALFGDELPLIVGAHLKTLVCKESRDALAPLLEARLSGSVERRELCITCATPAKAGVYAEASASRLEEDRILVMFRDVTNRRRIREELLQAKIAAEDANQAKSEFLANMSHEIRTPIAGILGITDMALNMKPNPVIADLLTKIRKATGGLLDIINDILDFSKIEARRLELYAAGFNLSDRLDRLAEVYGPRAQDKGLALEVKRLGRGLRILGDAGRLDQVLANLLSNAIKFTEQGRVSLGVEVLEEDEAGVSLKFMVSDTGSGIPEEKQRFLFKTFSQLEKGTRRSYGGAGLGLAISKRLVELMQGSIWLEPGSGKGATFAFTIRFPWAEQTEEPRHEAPPRAAEIRPAKQGRRILLAEDNPINQEFVIHFLEEAGHTVRVADNGREALAALAEEPFDLVLMDVQMPVMDGLEATRRIRGHKEGKYDPDIPVVALTAYAMKGDRERMLEAGMSDYLPKPVDMGALYELIDRLTDRE